MAIRIDALRSAATRQAAFVARSLNEARTLGLKTAFLCHSHINQIKGKDQLTKSNGPNPFDYLALKYSDDGRKVEVFEAKDGKWVVYAKLSGYTLKKTAAEQRWGKLFKLSALGYKSYCWSEDDGYKNFADWAG